MSTNNIENNLSQVHQAFPRQSLDLWWKKVGNELGNAREIDEIAWKIEDGIEVLPMPPKFQLRPTEPCYTRQAWRIVEDWSKVPTELEWAALVDHGVDEVALSISEVNASSGLSRSHPDISIFASRAVLASLLPNKAVCFAQIREVDVPNANGEAPHPGMPWRSARSGTDESPSKRLESILLQLICHLKKESEPSAILSSRYRVYMEVSSNYLTEIATIRALRILLLNLWKAFGLDLKQCPKIYAEVEYAKGVDENTNLIVQTSKAVSAVLGGADALSIKSPNTSDNARYRRLSRNIHHILRSESNLHHRVDPLEGSHLLEHLTSRFATKAWNGIKGADL